VLFGPDLTAFVREGNTRGLFERRTVVSLLTGEPEYMIPLGDETPEAGSSPAIPGTGADAARPHRLRRGLSRAVQ